MCLRFLSVFSCDDFLWSLGNSVPGDCEEFDISHETIKFNTGTFNKGKSLTISCGWCDGATVNA